MTVSKATVLFNDGLYEIDAIEHAGESWLVPEWLDTPRKGYSRPARLIRLSQFPYQLKEGRFFVQCSSMPISAFFDEIQIPQAVPYEVLVLPDLEFETHSVGPVH